MALDTGLLRADALTPLTSFGESLGLTGTVYHVDRVGGRLFAATAEGLFQLQPANERAGGVTEREARFVPVGGSPSQARNVWGVDGRALVAMTGGLYEVEGDEARLVTSESAWVLVRSDSDRDRIYVGTREGLSLLRRRGGRWEEAEHADGVRGGVRSVAESGDGSVWLGTTSEGLVRVWLDDGRVARAETYGERDGLPAGPVSVYWDGEDLLFHAPAGVFRATEKGGHVRFTPDAPINAALEPDGESYFLVDAPRPGRLWILKGGRVSAFNRTTDGAYEDVTPPALRIDGLLHEFLYVEPETGVVWVAGEQGLIRYDPTVVQDYAVPYAALVREVTVGGDSLLFGGAVAVRYPRPELAFAANDPTFTFSAPTYNAPGATEYQYWLQGFDAGWSRWTSEASKGYTNLPENGYRFHVRARNAQGVVSQEAIYAFDVLPPWYRTVWAYALYVVCGAVVPWAYGNLRVRRNRRKLAHEQGVNRRLDVANDRLREANERLHHANDLKDTLLADTSHELRTPLTLMIAPLQDLLTDEAGLSERVRRSIEGPLQSARRLAELVDQILTLSRLEAADVRLDLRPADLGALVRARVAAFGPAAECERIALTVEVPPAPVVVRLDPEAMTRIVDNLLSNAVKYTPGGGHVGVTLERQGASVELRVADTGTGIADEALPHVFERYYRAADRAPNNAPCDGVRPAKAGTGIGLALARELVLLHGGTIGVESEAGPEGSGTVFTVRLPSEVGRNAAADGGAPAGATGDGPTTFLPSVEVLGTPLSACHGRTYPRATALERPWQSKRRSMPPVTSTRRPSSSSRTTTPSEPTSPSGSGGTSACARPPTASRASPPPASTPPTSSSPTS